MKRVPRNKLLLCFRPGIDSETVIDSKNHVHSSASATLASYLDLEHGESCPDCRCSKNSGRDSSTISRPPKQTLSRTFRAVMFGTILIKRVRERKGNHEQKSNRPKRSFSLDSGSSTAKEDEMNSLPSGSSSRFPISISKPIICSSPTWVVPKTSKQSVRQINADDRSWYSLNSGVGLLVVSLGAVTVMEGRVFAILITSIWVYFFAWMRMEDQDRCLKKKKKTTKFPETEVTGKMMSGCHNRRAHDGKKKEKQEKALNL